MYTFLYLATDVCASGKHNCHADAKCITHVGGSHLCQCKAGFTGDGTICTGKFVRHGKIVPYLKLEEWLQLPNMS